MNTIIKVKFFQLTIEDPKTKKQFPKSKVSVPYVGEDGIEKHRTFDLKMRDNVKADIEKAMKDQALTFPVVLTLNEQSEGKPADYNMKRVKYTNKKGEEHFKYEMWLQGYQAIEQGVFESVSVMDVISNLDDSDK